MPGWPLTRVRLQSGTAAMAAGCWAQAVLTSRAFMACQARLTHQQGCKILAFFLMLWQYMTWAGTLDEGCCKPACLQAHASAQAADVSQHSRQNMQGP